MAGKFAGKRVVVTGCSSGMGAAVAARLLADGAEVHGLDIRAPETTLASFHKTDLRDPASIETAALAIGGPVHALFHCAGLPQTFPTADVIRVNFIGLRHLTERLLPCIPPGGSVVVISSMGGMNWRNNLDHHNAWLATTGFEEAAAWADAHPDVVKDGYAFSKEAVNVWVQAMGTEYIKRGVRINATLPAPTDTPMLPDFHKVAGAHMVGIFSEPAGRLSTPDEQAGPVVFLGSDDAAFINGHLLNVDGGFFGGIAVGRMNMAELVAAARAKAEG